MALQVHKVIASLPATLTPDAIYAVRAGAGFDLYIADATGSVAHKVNTTEIVSTDGTTTLSWASGRLVRVDYPDGSYLVLTWTAGVLTSAVLHRGGKVRTVSLTWLSGVLQSTTTTTV